MASNGGEPDEPDQDRSGPDRLLSERPDVGVALAGLTPTGPLAGLTPTGRSRSRSRGGRTRTRRGIGNPLGFIVRWVEWFESRGVYVPGEDSRSLSPWRDFGWIIVAWLLTVAAFVVMFAVAS